MVTQPEPSGFVPPLLQEGTPLTKVTAAKKRVTSFKLDADEECIVWDSKKVGKVAIESIREIRSGREAAEFYKEQFQVEDEHDDRWISIIYILDGRYKTLHLIAADEGLFRLWVNTLQSLYQARQKLMRGLGYPEERRALWERRYWKRATGSDNKKVDFERVDKMGKKLDVGYSKEDMKIFFNVADSQNHGFLTFPEFQKLARQINTRPDVEALYLRVMANRIMFDFEVFKQFMQVEQMSTLDDGELNKIFLKYATPQDVPAQARGAGVTSLHAMTVENFTHFLLSNDNSVLQDQGDKVFHDMTHPLPDYYISTSHNTYLVGHQLVGISTIEGYVRALLHGCRSVELDIYDGELEPIIYHGKTLTSKVSLRDACKAIIRYAFVTSPYPVIVSAEVHCSVPQQEMVAAIMREVFGSALITAPLDPTTNLEKLEKLPSPEELKGRIMLKTKNKYVSENSELVDDTLTVRTEPPNESSLSSASDMETGPESKSERVTLKVTELKSEFKEEFAKAKRFFKGHISPAASPRRVASPLPETTSTPAALSTQRVPKVKMSQALLDLLIYTVGVKCRGINKKEKYLPQHLFSLSERTTNKMFKHGWWDLLKHNRTHLTRIYPNGTRVKSTNYEPHKYWCMGAQLVAINWQTIDLGFVINHIMFQRNGRAGYILKPSILSGPKENFEKRTQNTLDITIISAQHLPHPKDLIGRESSYSGTVDPYVVVSIHVPEWPNLHPSPSPAGSPLQSPPVPAVLGSGSGSTPPVAAPRTIYMAKTKMVKNNGFNPVWDELVSLPFECVEGLQDLVFIKIAVMDANWGEDEPLALYCVSLGNLREGYRHLPLYDIQLAQNIFASMFVHFNLKIREKPRTPA